MVVPLAGAEIGGHALQGPGAGSGPERGRRRPPRCLPGLLDRLQSSELDLLPAGKGVLAEDLQREGPPGRSVLRVVRGPDLELGAVTQEANLQKVEPEHVLHQEFRVLHLARDAAGEALHAHQHPRRLICEGRHLQPHALETFARAGDGCFAHHGREGNLHVSDGGRGPILVGLRPIHAPGTKLHHLQVVLPAHDLEIALLLPVVAEGVEQQPIVPAV
mmetsp:Transcript_106946/g.332307  ORF Transcript_106946/g.332307 Transcript_106946/m.332307 type:complete len:218 (+) Transcript_106946:3-656(+)